MSNFNQRTRLQRKVAVSLVLLFSVFIVVSYSILTAVIGPAFDALESKAARADLHRAEAALQADIDRLYTVVSDWSAWDDIYNFIGGSNPAFEKSNLDGSTLETLDLDVLSVYDSGSRQIWSSSSIDRGARTFGSLDIFKPEHALFQMLTVHDNPDSEVIGLVQTDSGPMLIGSLPILRTDGSGPIAGTLVMGQLLDNAHLGALRARTEVDMVWAEVDSDGDLEPQASLTVGRDVISGAKVLNDIDGRPVLKIRTHLPREISSLGSQTLRAAMYLLVLTGVLVCGFMWFMLRHTIMQPMHELASHIGAIRESGDLSHKLAMRRNDEIGSLADQFDELTQEVNDARRLLLDQSFKAGKADTAAEVMHNVRNAMTPTINGVDRIHQLFRDSRNLRIADALQQLEDPNCTPERKQKLLRYISVSFDRLKDIGDEIMTEINVVASQTKQIEGILSDQERYSSATPVAEVLVIDELVEEASNIIPKDQLRAVNLVREESLCKQQVRAYRIGLLQVLGNLLLNAFESICRHGRQEGQISLASTEELVDETPMVRLTVSDNGAGFDQATADKLFRRGFTSKQQSEFAGLGLHWCANAVAGMGGRLTAESLGEGNGARFHVLLPAA